MLMTNNFWVQVALAVILAVAIVAAMMTAAPASVLDRITAAAGSAGEALDGEQSGLDQARSPCWLCPR